MMDISVSSELDMTMILNPAEVKAELSDLVSNFGSDTDKVDDGERASKLNYSHFFHFLGAD